MIPKMWRNFKDKEPTDRLPGERWKQVKEAPRYWVSSKGRVAGRKGIMKPQFDDRGYQYVTIRLGKSNKTGKVVLRRVHRLVALVFLRPVKGKTTVHHIDFNKNNNNLSNLKWVEARTNSILSCKGKGIRVINTPEFFLACELIIARRNGARTAEDFGKAVADWFKYNAVISKKIRTHTYANKKVGFT